MRCLAGYALLGNALLLGSGYLPPGGPCAFSVTSVV